MEDSILPENSAPMTGNREIEESGTGFREEGNRWPREETLALLKIRSDMDLLFRDSNPKGPLWEEVSRKMSELGYNRNAKKCKEKFENIYKYHRRTKEGRSVKQNGKAYKYFEQLEALDNIHVLSSSSPADKVHTPLVTATNRNPMDTTFDAVNITSNVVPSSTQSHSMNVGDNSSNSSESTSSRESEGTRNKKRKLMEFFEHLMKEVVEKQENLQKKFLEALEKCEQERMAREEAWKKQELDRIKRERELLAQERSMAAAKDAAVLSFLQKFLGQGSTMQLLTNQIVPEQLPKNQTIPSEDVTNTQENSTTAEKFAQIGSSRWPKEEIEALIRLRSNLDVQYQDNGPKGPLWEEISSLMKKLGYNRSAKRCKEKWENMNKYFKRVRESNKKRPGDAKTCPYFNQLDALYKEKTRKADNPTSSHYELRPEELLLHMMAGQEEGQHHESATTEDGESENADQSQEQEEQGEKEDGDGYQIVSNVSSSVAIME